jgi:hypothetical protein
VPLAAEQLLGEKYLALLEGHLRQLHRAYPHPNRVLFYDDLLVAYLLAFFNPTARSLRGIEDLSRLPGAAEHLSVQKVCRSTLSDANRLMDATLLEPLIEQLRARLPNLGKQDAKLGALLKQVIAVDGSFFNVAADVTWALARRDRDGDERRCTRLNLQLDCASGVPVGVSISGAGETEVDAARRDIRPDVIYLMDRGYIHFEYLKELLAAQADFVLRLSRHVLFVTTEERALTAGDRVAGVISDRIGFLAGSPSNSPPQTLLREVRVFNENNPDQPIRLLTSLMDVPAEVVAALYRWRWQIELFFRWLKVHAHFEHLISHSKNGLTIGFHVAVIAVLLIHLRTGRGVSKYAYNMLAAVAAGWGTLGDILPILEQRERERERERQRRARKRAAAKATP